MGILLETAHPVKFYDVVEPLTKEKVPLPEAVASLIGQEKKSIFMEADYNQLKEIISYR
jgi:threonine synthase